MKIKTGSLPLSKIRRQNEESNLSLEIGQTTGRVCDGLAGNPGLSNFRRSPHALPRSGCHQHSHDDAGRPLLVSPTAAITLVAATETPVPLPTLTSAPTLTSTSAPAASGLRLRFATGATASITEGQIQAGQAQNFVVGANARQPMIIMVDSPNQDVTFSVTGQKDGIVLLPASQKATSWQAMLTTSQDYLIRLYGSASSANFTMNVVIPARIDFEPGAISAQRSGSTPDGLIVSYVLRAKAGQKMKLQLDTPDGSTVLGLYGYQDGQPYLRSTVEVTSFELTLPATQDYIIQVIPRGGEVADYELDVQIN